MSGIKLSICIPTYNREAYLRNALSDSPPESTAVFVSVERDREYFVALGYLPNLVLHEHDVARHVLM